MFGVLHAAFADCDLFCQDGLVTDIHLLFPHGDANLFLRRRATGGLLARCGPPFDRDFFSRYRHVNCLVLGVNFLVKVDFARAS